MRLTDLSVKWEETGGWTFRLEGVVEADEETSREICGNPATAAGQEFFAHSFNDETAAAPWLPSPRNTNATVPEMQRFSVVMEEFLRN